jgi:hypothetical protein
VSLRHDAPGRGAFRERCRDLRCASTRSFLAASREGGGNTTIPMGSTGTGIGDIAIPIGEAPI